MKKFSILLAAVALMAMTACNEKDAKNNENAQGNTTEQVEKAAGKADSAGAVKVEPMEKAAPTADGKDHTVAKFNTKEYEVTVENLANGNYRVTMKDGKDDKVYETSNCRIQGESYLMQTADGTNVLINGKDGKIVVMNKSGIIYKGASK